MILFLQDPDERKNVQERKKKSEKRKKFMEKLEENKSVQEVSTWATKHNYKKTTIKSYLKYYRWAQSIKISKQKAKMTILIKWNKWQRYLLQHIQYTNFPSTFNNIFIVLNPNSIDQKMFASNFCHIKHSLDTIFFEGTLSNELMNKFINNPYTKNILFNVNYYTKLSKQFYQTVNLTRDLKLPVKIIILTPKALNWNYFDTDRLKIMLIENETFQIRNYLDHITYINTNINKYYS